MNNPAENNIIAKLREILQKKNNQYNGLNLAQMEQNQFIKLKFTDLGLDSLDLAEIIMEIEEKFNIKLDDSEVSKLESIEQLSNMIGTYHTSA